MSSVRRDMDAARGDSIALSRDVPGGPGTAFGTSPLVRVRRSGLFFAGCLILGTLLGLGATALRGPRYRATATLLVVEPRGSGPGSVDFQLTPIRSYTALLGSPVLAAACATSATPPALKIRMPESTRLLEVSAEGEDAAGVAAFAGCVATRAVEENKRLNAEVARRGETQLAAVVSTTRADVEKLEGELARLRVFSLIETKRALLKSVQSQSASAADEERLARQHVEEEDARAASYEDSAKHPAARETAENGAAEARANAAASRAAVAAAARARGAAETRATALENEITARENELIRTRRNVDGAAAALTELEKKSVLAPLESASKAFDLLVVAPPPPIAPRVGPSRLLMAVAGAIAAGFLGALVILSRPE